MRGLSTVQPGNSNRIVARDALRPVRTGQPEGEQHGLRCQRRMNLPILPDDLREIRPIERGAKTVLNRNINFLIGRIVGNRERRLLLGRR